MVTRNREREIEEFAGLAERDRLSAPVKPAKKIPAWKIRNKEPKTKGYTLRVSPSQLELLRIAHEDQDISQQKVLENLIWPALEEQYGEGASGR